MNEIMSGSITKATVAARTQTHNQQNTTSSSSDGKSSTGKSEAHQNFASRAAGVTPGQRQEKEEEIAAAQLQKPHEIDNKKTEVPKLRRQDEEPIDDYPKKRPRESVHYQKRDDKRIRDRREPMFDSIDFSSGLLEILDASVVRPPLTGMPHLYNEFSTASLLNWGSGRFLDFFI